MWSLDFIRHKNHDKQGSRGKKWRFFHNFATFVRERLPFIYTDGIVHDYGLFRYYLYVTDYIISIVIRTLYFPVRLPGDIEFFLPYRQYILNKNNKNFRKQQIFNGFYCWYGICYPFFHGLEKTAPKGVLCDLIN